MGLRPAKCYRTMKRPYSRTSVRVQKKAFITGVPASKIREFEMGNKKAPFDWKIELITKRAVQIRSNAMEAARVTGNKTLEKNAGTSNYHFRLTKYPHHVLRENCMATGAGADRFSTGMAKAFGKNVGTAARVQAGETVVYVRLNNQFFDLGKTTLKKAGLKLGIAGKLKVTQLRELTTEIIKVKIVKEKKEKPAEGEEAEAGKEETGKEGKEAKEKEGKASDKKEGKASDKKKEKPSDKKK